MSLTITSKLKTLEGIEVENSYARVLVVDNFAGVQIDAAMQVFLNEATYLAGSAPLNLDILNNTAAPYDRAAEGTDILDLAHDSLITALAQQGVTAVKNL